MTNGKIEINKNKLKKCVMFRRNKFVNKIGVKKKVIFL